MSSRTLLVCCGTGCLANRAAAVVAALEAAIASSEVDAVVSPDAIELKQTGCNGFCENGPIVKVHPDDISYYRVKPQHAEKIVASLGGEPYAALLYRGDDKQPLTRQSDNPFYAHQQKIALRNIGEIDPLALDDYLARGGYVALQKALRMTPDAIISEVEASGLRGRGGAGFPTGTKWRSCAGYPATPKYVVCNGDEGDPGAFMDRSLLEGDPHSVLEGLAIAALGIGAEQGFLYIRDEYGLAIRHVAAAIKAAEEHGFLGDDICGSGCRLHLEIVRGGGAFVCGESTALMASIEGRVGEPRAKYIRSAERGLWDKPTVLNNVETLANIPVIITGGGASYAAIGTERSKGTKVFSLVGKVNRTGLVEVVMGATLRHLIFDIGGGIRSNRAFKAVQTGGPSGGCIPESLLSLPVDFDSLTEAGAMMGSGGMIVMDEHDCMVEVARYYLNFLSEESCGKCTPCREGLRHLLAILTDITEGRGKEGDLELLERICNTLIDSSLCALGKSAPNPVLTTLKFFRDEYLAHIREHRCPAGVCPTLTTFEIDANVCTSCGVCRRACPTGAITGEKTVPYRIDKSGCIACGSCREVCRFAAVKAIKRDKPEVVLWEPLETHCAPSCGQFAPAPPVHSAALAQLVPPSTRTDLRQIDSQSGTQAVSRDSRMITIKINDREVTCEKGEYLLDVARRNGIVIPSLCHHDGLEGLGGCRVCICEVTERDRARIVASCIYPVERACEVQTMSDRVVEQRGITLELLRKLAPQSRQIQVMASYNKAPKLERLKPHVASAANAGNVATAGNADDGTGNGADDGKCILCQRCVAACRELGAGAITAINRGVTKEIATPYHEPSKNCIGCLSCAEVCPTGHITYSEDEQSRTIGGRTFKLEHCRRCGKVISTGELVADAAARAGQDANSPCEDLCEDCRKRAIANGMVMGFGS